MTTFAIARKKGTGPFFIASIMVLNFNFIAGLLKQ